MRVALEYRISQDSVPLHPNITLLHAKLPEISDRD